MLLLLTRQSPFQQNKMNPMETETQLDLAELSHSQPGTYSALLNEILASPAEVPSPLPSSNNFRSPASATNCSIDQRFMDLEARLFERQEKMSETLRLMTQGLNVLSNSVKIKQSVTPTAKPTPSHSNPRFCSPMMEAGLPAKTSYTLVKLTSD